MNTKKIKELKEKKKELEEKIEDLEDQLRLIAIEYESFFLSKKNDKNAKFKLYRLPSIEKCKTYMENHYGIAEDYDGNLHHPLDYCKYAAPSSSYFNYEELAVLLKLIYQFETGKEYGISTFGNMDDDSFLCNVYPKIHYVVGEKEKLKQCDAFNGRFYEEIDKFSFEKSQQGLIAVSEVADERVFLDEFFQEPDLDYGKTIDYFEYKTVGQMARGYFKKQRNIFKKNFELEDIKSHRDLFTFSIAKEDNFISNILYSIMMYKRRRGITTLKDEDYAEIIFTLYNEDIMPVSKQVEEEIPKTLIYMESQIERDKYMDSRW